MLSPKNSAALKVVLFCICFGNPVNADTSEPAQKIWTGLSVGMGKNTQQASLGLAHHWAPFAGRSLAFVSGVRYNAFWEQRTEYRCNPNCTDAILVAPEAKTNHAVNLMLGVQYNLSAFFAGFNIDVVGFNLGKNEYALNQAGVTYAGESKTFNLLKIGFNDIGSLNSEFYVGYLLSENLSARLGYSHTFSHYASKDGVNPDAKLFFDLFFVNVSYRLWAK